MFPAFLSVFLSAFTRLHTISCGKKTVPVPFQKTHNFIYITVCFVQDFFYFFSFFPVKPSQNPPGFSLVVKAFILLLTVLCCLCQSFFACFLLFCRQYDVIHISCFRRMDIHVFPSFPTLRSSFQHHFALFCPVMNLAVCSPGIVQTVGRNCLITNISYLTQGNHRLPVKLFF